MIEKVCMVLVLAAFTKATSPEDAWNNFLAHRPMSFSSEEEMQHRKMNFFSTHDVIEKHNNKPGVTFKLEHNRFSTMSPEEKKSFLGAVPQAHPHRKNNTRSLAIDDLITDRQAASVDWRTDKCMQPVKNQASCGSCWAFAATTVTEFNTCVKTGTAVALSDQQLVSCDTSNGACNGGWPPNAWRYVANAGGQNTQASYPYTSGSGSVAACKFSKTSIAARISTTTPTTYIQSGDTATMMKVLSNKGLILVAICVTNPFYSYKSGVFTDTTCGSSGANHAVVAVGYGTLNGIPYWIIRNSWGSSWGSAGYVLFRRGTNLCQVEKYPMYTTAA